MRSIFNLGLHKSSFTGLDATGNVDAAMYRSNYKNLRRRKQVDWRVFVFVFWRTKLVSDEDAQITQIIARGPSDHGVPKRMQKRIRVEACERLFDGIGFEAITLRNFKRSGHSSAINHGASGGTIAVNAVSTSTQHDDAFTRNLFGAGQGKLLVASAGAAVANSHRYFAP
jgi:hypothetical protein